jgi:hypothetical protein
VVETPTKSRIHTARTIYYLFRRGSIGIFTETEGDKFMPDFSKYFEESKGQPIIYNGVELVLGDRIPVPKKFSGTVRLISTNSEYKQAVRLDVMRGKLIMETGEGKGLCLWEDYLRDSVCHFTGVSNDMELLVHNAWQHILWTGVPTINHWTHGAAMIVEIEGNKRTYRCNDGHPDENFDDIVFEVIINE